MIKKITYTVLLTCLIVGCNDKPSNYKKIITSTDTSYTSLQKKSFVNSEAFREEFKELGEYDSLEHFLLNLNTITEFRIELLNIYDSADLHKSINMMEVTWSYNLVKNKTTWYQQDSLKWKKVQQVVWSKGAEF